jgi:hypothetical protein
MATSFTLQNDPALPQGYLKVDGSTSATFTTSGITGNLTGNADTATKLAGTTGSAPSYACRAWVNFDGTRDSSGAVSTANTNRLIRASGNVTSVLRTNAGAYSVTFTTPMSDSNYSLVISCIDPNGGSAGSFVSLSSTSASIQSIRLSPLNTIDMSIICVQIFS